MIKFILTITTMILLVAGALLFPGLPKTSLTVEAHNTGRTANASKAAVPVSFQIDPQEKTPAEIDSMRKACKLQGFTPTSIYRTGTTVQSPELSNFMATFNKPKVNYGQTANNSVFGDSLKLPGTCKVCLAVLTANLKVTGGIPGTDTFSVGRAPYTPAPRSVFGIMPWPSTTPIGTTKIFNFVLPTLKFNTFLATPAPSDGYNGYLDVFVQDDTQVNNLTLEIWQ